jgi:hypothetical protein
LGRRQSASRKRIGTVQDWRVFHERRIGNSYNRVFPDSGATTSPPLPKGGGFMTVPIPANTLFAYNNFVFPVYIKTKLIQKPLLAGDGRMTKYSELTIAASGWITQNDADNFTEDDADTGDTLDDFMEDMRKSLSVNGKALQYVNRGYGANLNVNGQTLNLGGQVIPPIRDVAMGPQPGKLVWWPLGGAPDGCHGAGFEWEVTTWIAECDTFNLAQNVFVELWFTVTFDTDEAGLVTITYSGNGQIPLSLQPNNTLQYNIDSMIAGVIRPVPAGFLRKINRQLSPDRANCRFTVVDRQIEAPYPHNVVNIEMREKIRQSEQMSPRWICSISGTVRMDPGVPKFLAWARFFNIASQRMTAARSQNVPGALKAGVIPGTVEMEEDLFKNESRFVVNFVLIGVPFESIVRSSGLWRPLSVGSNPPVRDSWTAVSWTSSLSGSAQATTGLLGATFDNANEVIIDPCGGAIGTRAVAQPPIETRTPDGVITTEYTLDPQVDLAPLEPNGLLQDAGYLSDNAQAMFPPASSWVAWECTVQRVTDHKQIRHKPLAGTVAEVTPTIDPLGTIVQVSTDTTLPTAGWSSTVNDVFQQVGAPSMIVRMRGFGVRMVYRVSPPKLVTYGGQPAVLLWESVSEREQGVSHDIIMYRTNWDLIYMIQSAPQTLQLPANPFLNTEGPQVTQELGTFIAG